MASRQSQLHSYQFTVQRAVSALVAREPDPAQSPFRKVVGATFVSAMIAILALAAVGIYGLIVSGGKTTWKRDHLVIVERESGAKYVYLADHKLHPVLNYASALLIAQAPEPTTMSVSGKSLAGAARGTPLGIPGAPDSLPPAGRLLRMPWTVCTSVVRQANLSPQPQSVLLVGQPPAHGRVLGEDEAFFVKGGNTEYMIWNSHKYRVTSNSADQKVVHDALQVRTQVPNAAPAFLNALPPGSDLGTVKITDTGPSKVAGFAAGDVVQIATAGGGFNYYVVLVDGLAAITQLQANLIGSERAAQPREQSDGWYNAQPKSQRNLTPSDGRAALPERPPTVARPPDEQRAACGVFGDASGVPQIVVDATPPATDQAVVTGSQSDASAVLADRVVVTPSRGAVVEAVQSPDASAGTLCLITDLGTAYPVPSREVLRTLGYGAVNAVRVPAALVGLLPQGRALDPEAARAPAVGG